MKFRIGPFVDPQGNDTFAAMEWRLAEVTPPRLPPLLPGQPRRYEIEAVWESKSVDVFREEIRFPDDVTTPDKTYRARAQVKDATGRWSHWSPPVEFLAGD